MNKSILRSGKRKWPQTLGTSILILVVLFQFIQLIRIEVLPEANLVVQQHKANSTERGAFFFAGEGFSEFIAFINQNVPPEATIFIPRFEQHELFGHEGIMDFFLFPRKVENCSPNIPVEECILNLGDPNTYILAVEGFPPHSAAVRVKLWVPFQEEWGVYVPPP